MTHPPVTTTLQCLQAFEPDQLLEAVRGAHLEHYLLSGSACTARLAHWSCGNFSVDTGNYNFPVRVVGGLANNRMSIGYMRKIRQPSWVNGFSCTLETIELYPEKAELNYRAAEGGEWVMIDFEKDELQRVARESFGHEVILPWKSAVGFSISRERRALLDRQVRQLWMTPFFGSVLTRPILETLAEFLREANGCTRGASQLTLVKRQALLARAEIHIRENISHPFNLDALALAAGASVRTLQREFLAAYGFPPHKWARCLMLHAVRRRLRSVECKKLTVEAIANECGFRHMGRFAKYYHDLFGEYPSRTVHQQSS